MEWMMNMPTGLQQDIRAFLRGSEIAVSVDLAVIRIDGLFSFSNKNVSQLLYHPNACEHKPLFKGPCGHSIGRWSISPFIMHGGQEHSPLGKIDGKHTVALDEGANTLTLRNVECQDSDVAFDWSVAVDGNALIMHVTAERGHCVGVEMNLYPLYTHVLADGVREALDYQNDHEIHADCVELVDQSGRMPSLRISAAHGNVVVSGFVRAQAGHHLDAGDAAVLNVPGLGVRVFSDTHDGVFRLEQLCPAKVRVTHDFDVDIVENAQRIGDALLTMRDKLGADYPLLAGMIPAQYHLETHGPMVGNSKGYVVATYMPRAAMSLAAAALATGERRYVDAAMHAMENYLKRCPHRRDGGGVHVVGAFDRNGMIVDADYDESGNLKDCFYNRPSNFAIFIRGLLACHDVYRRIGDTDAMAEALELALEVLRGLDWVFGIGWVYVNNPHYALAKLVLALEQANHEHAGWARQYVCRDLAWRGYDKPLSRLRIAASGAEESNPNTEQDFASFVSEAMAAWLLDMPNKDDCRNRVLQLNRVMTLTQRYFPDSSELYGASIVEDLGRYVGGYDCVMCHGGMWDLVRIEMLQAAADYFDDDFSRQAAGVIAKGRLMWSLKENGSLYGLVQKCPGVHYRNSQWGETLNYGSLGIWLLAKLL